MYFFCNRVLSYFAKPNFIVYDEWFDNDFQKTKLNVKNKKITNISKIHEFFYKQSKANLLICLSTSGNSLNIIKAINEAEKKGIEVISFLGKEGGRASKLVKEKIIVDSNTTARIQEMHQLIYHNVCNLID